LSANIQIIQKNILNLPGQELSIFLRILNHTSTMCSDKTLNYECAKLNHNMQANPTKELTR